MDARKLLETTPRPNEQETDRYLEGRIHSTNNKRTPCVPLGELMPSRPSIFTSITDAECHDTAAYPDTEHQLAACSAALMKIILSVHPRLDIHLSHFSSSNPSECHGTPSDCDRMSM